MPSKTPGTPISRYRDAMAREPAPVGAFVEGDSWFAFPMFLRTNIITELRSRFRGRLVLLDESANGDEVREILSGKSYNRIAKILSTPSLTFDCILFSGGGNDLVGEHLSPMLQPYRNGMAWDECIDFEQFDRRLAEIRSAYLNLAALRNMLRPEAWVFTHAYDYAIPSGKPVRLLGIGLAGGWLKKVMSLRGIPLVVQHQIVEHLLAQFDNMMLGVAGGQTRWRHVRTQDTLADDEWDDELHPSTAGFKKVAGKFADALFDVFKGRLT